MRGWTMHGFPDRLGLSYLKADTVAAPRGLFVLADLTDGHTERTQQQERLATVGHRGVEDFVVQAAEFLRPLVVELFGAFLDGEFVLAIYESDRRGRFCD